VASDPVASNFLGVDLVSKQMFEYGHYKHEARVMTSTRTEYFICGRVSCYILTTVLFRERSWC